MSATFKPLVQGTYLAAATGTLYTATQRTRIDRFSVTNASGSAVTITLRVRPASESSDANNHRIYNAVTIPGDGDPVDLSSMLRTLNPGDLVRGNASTGNVVSVFADGVVFT